MSILDSKRLSQIPRAIKYLLFLAVVVFISLLFPNYPKFKYSFELGQNWRYEELIAPFDFPIKKAEQELETERLAVEQTINPFYQLDLDAIERQTTVFEQAFDEQLTQAKEDDLYQDVVKQPETYLQFGRQYLNQVFREGIVELSGLHQEEEKTFVVDIIEGNSVFPKTLESLVTVEQVRSQLQDVLLKSDLPEPDFLLYSLEQAITPNILFEEGLTSRRKEKALTEVQQYRDLVRKGDLIVLRNAPIDEETYQKLISFQEQFQKEITRGKSVIGVYVGYLLLTSLIMGLFLIYLLIFARSVFDRFNELIFILIWIVIFSYLVYFLEVAGILSAYIIPFAIIPIIVRTFYHDQLALFVHIVIVLIASFLSSLDYEFTFLQILIGIVVLLCNVNTRDWTKFFYSILYIFLTYSLGYIGLTLIKEGAVQALDWKVFSWFFLNVFFTLLAFPLIPLLERLFGFVSSISLVELSQMNRPLLQELNLQAPGTLQHSLQVANLSEAAAQKIGANPLLARVAALYHDIGKAKRPEFFIENQTGENPHDELDALESAKIIIDHVNDGVEMAKKNRLPGILTDFIRTHHGTTRVEYFYRKFVENDPDREFDETLFRYPGPKPRTKEETIVMLADSVEAACKSLKAPTEKDLVDLIEKIVAGKIGQGQLSDSELSFQEMDRCIEVFKQVMKSTYHSRITYPEKEQKEEADAASTQDHEEVQ